MEFAGAVQYVLSIRPIVESRAPAYNLRGQWRSMRGIQYVVNESGNKTAVVIDLREHGDLWEDFYDNLVAESRRDEELIPWEKIKEEERLQGSSGRLAGRLRRG
jgi:hypothetical protein